jgi:NAD+ synthase
MSLLYTLAQINPIVGDLAGNYQKICDYYEQAEKQGSFLCITPELSLIGYPPQDLILKPALALEAEHYLQLLIKQTTTKKCGLLVGSVSNKQSKLYNTAYLIYNGQIITAVTKHNLPNYGVFDEKRIFSSGDGPAICNLQGKKIGLIICEDFWFDETMQQIVSQNPDILICINDSPFEVTKHQIRLNLAHKYTHLYQKPLIYVNQIGGQDNLVFDGGSFVMNQKSELVLQAKFFTEQIIHLDLNSLKSIAPIIYSEEQIIYQAAMLGLKDYVQKNNFSKVILGLSGGIDSALTAAIAADALGSDKVMTFMLPSKYTSQTSIGDAQELANNLKITHQIIPIEVAVDAVRTTIPPTNDITDQNMQARMRGLILMAISNNTGALLITTGNKSELAVGYATLYGDMCGAYNPIKDIYKTAIYKLCYWRNQNIPENSLINSTKIIPENILDKAPSAELKSNQTDQDNLPPYELLDQILYQLIEQNMSQEDIIAAGFEQNIVEKIIKLLHAAEFKRQQSAPGAKISKMSFNIDRRYPITNKFKK